MAIKLTFAEIEQAAADIDTALANMNSQLATLKSQLEPIRVSWDGAARAEYDLRQAEWDSAAARIAELLGSFSRAVTRAGATMAETEAANQRGFML